jgi:hypothetical protein
LTPSRLLSGALVKGVAVAREVAQLVQSICHDAVATIGWAAAQAYRGVASASARRPLLLRTNGGIPFNCKQLLPDFVHTDEWELTRYFASLAVATLARRTR